MVFAAGFLDLSVREHLIISSGGHYSFMKEGLIDGFEKDFEKLRKKLAQGKS